MMRSAMASIIPVRSRAPDRMNMAPMVMGAGLEKTENSPSASNMPRNRKAHDPMIATTVAGKRSITKPMNIRSEEHTSELQSLMRISYAVFCLKQKKIIHQQDHKQNT